MEYVPALSTCTCSQYIPVLVRVTTHHGTRTGLETRISTTLVRTVQVRRINMWLGLIEAL